MGLVELPKAIYYHQPRIVLEGNRQLYLENHLGIVLYETQKVIIRCQGGELIVEGKNLSLALITDEEIYVEGEIRQVGYEF